MADAQPGGVTWLLADLRAGDVAAAGRLTDLVYDQLRALAEGQFRRQPVGRAQTLQPTALVNEVFLRMLGRADVEWRDRAHFFAACATVMRGILADYARRRLAAKRGGGWQRVTLSGIATPSESDVVDLIDLNDALSRLADLHERQARIVEYRFFADMSEDEIAHVLGVSRSTVAGEWKMARAWLSAQLRRCDGS